MNDNRAERISEKRGCYAAWAACALAAAFLLDAEKVEAQNWTEYEVTGSISPVNAFPDSTWLCALSGVKGPFDDHDRDGGREFVKIDHTNPRWQISAGTGRTGRMACTRWSNFLRPAGSVLWVGAAASLSGYDYNSDFTKTTSLWWGDAASMISFMEGEFEGTGEYIQITQNTNASSPSSFAIHSEAGSLLSSTDLAAQAISVFVGNPDNHWPLRLIGYGPNGKTRGTAASSGTFEMAVSTQSGFNTFWLADTSGANGGFCYFTRLSGDFNGNGESAVIKEVSATWQLKVTAGGNASAFAKARCMAYDQR